MTIRYYLKDGAILNAPSTSEDDFWTAMRDSSKFDSELSVAQYRLNFIARYKVQEGKTWSEIWKGNDINTLLESGYIEEIKNEPTVGKSLFQMIFG